MTEGRRERLPVTPAEPRREPDADTGQERGAERLPAPDRDAGAARERSGPLLVERHRKADGRALILYSEAAGDG